MEIKFIADIGSNHNQDFGRCKSLIDVAKDAGCWGVKFQLFDTEKLYRNIDNNKLKELTAMEIVGAAKEMDKAEIFQLEAVTASQPAAAFGKE